MSAEKQLKNKHSTNLREDVEAIGDFANGGYITLNGKIIGTAGPAEAIMNKHQIHAPNFAELLRLDAMAVVTGLERKAASTSVTPVDPADLAEYNRISTMFAEVEASPYWIDDYDGGGYLSNAPEPTITVEYAETQDEYHARLTAAFREIIAARDAKVARRLDEDAPE